jgi:hypothetical protein
MRRNLSNDRKKDAFGLYFELINRLSSVYLLALVGDQRF